MRLIALSVAALLLAAPPSRAETVTFGSSPIGDLPQGFQTSLTGQGLLGIWGVVPDPEAETGRALEQRTPDPTDYRFPLAIYQRLRARDVEVSVRFKPMYGKVDQAGGIAVRVIDAQNYYVARANALEGNVRFDRVVGGRREQIASAEAKVTSGQWHTLRMRAEGDRFTVTFDDAPLLAASDKTFGGLGAVALWTKADSITRFDSLDISSLDAPEWSAARQEKRM